MFEFEISKKFINTAKICEDKFNTTKTGIFRIDYFPPHTRDEKCYENFFIADFNFAFVSRKFLRAKGGTRRADRAFRQCAVNRVFAERETSGFGKQ